MKKTNILLAKTLYSQVKEFHENEMGKVDERLGPDFDVQHVDLLPTLRSYQARAVRWMLSMEKEERTIQIGHDDDTEVHLGKGGILADEMGLGKTVEVLACILAHPNTESAAEMEAYIEELSAKLNISRAPSTCCCNSSLGTEETVETEEETEKKPVVNDLLDPAPFSAFVKSESDAEENEEKVLPSDFVKSESDAGENKAKIMQDVAKIIEDVALSKECKPLLDLSINSNCTNKSSVNSNASGRRKRKRNAVSYSDDIYDDLEDIVYGNLTITTHKHKKNEYVKKNLRCRNGAVGNDVVCVYSNETTIKEGNETLAYMHSSTTVVINDQAKKIAEQEEYADDAKSKVDDGNDGNNVDDVAHTPRVRKRGSKRKKKRDDEDPTYVPLDSAEETLGNDEMTVIQQKGRHKRLKAGDDTTPSNRPVRGFLKKELNRWYEEILFETTPLYKQNKLALLRTESLFRCCCLDNSNTNDSDHVQCPICKKLQHSACVGITEKDYNKSDPYICFQCWPKQKTIPSGGTFIVSPSSISNQWLEEIKKHIRPGLKVFVYDGVRTNGYIQPTILARYDVVITNYQVLVKELDYVGLGNDQRSRSLRYPKKFFAPSSPLTCIKWWRLCLDEAQMVESVTNKMAEMVSELDATNRWAICGTPIQKSVSDLHGLVSFLRVRPYCENKEWERLLRNHDALLEFFPYVLWRTNKGDVLQELGVPAQRVVPHWLNFSPVESHFYQKQHMDCWKSFFEKIADLPSQDVPTDKIDRQRMGKMMAPLLRLRQACVHPQLIRGQFITLKKTMTMEELLNQMVSKAVVESEEALRVVISSLNGVAAIYIILGDLVEAVANYRQVLHFIQEYDGKLKIDSLQKIHTMHNLAEMLESQHPAIAPTLRDDTLVQDAQSIEKIYLEKRKGDMNNTKEALACLSTSISKRVEGMKLSEFDWWISMLHWMPDQKEFISKMKVELETNKGPAISLLSKVNNSYALVDEIFTWLGKVETQRAKVLDKLNQLEVGRPLDSLASEALNCHLKAKQVNRPRVGRRCLICHCELALKHYESLLFSIKNKQSDLNATLLDQTMLEDPPEEEDAAAAEEELNLPGSSKEEHRNIANLKAFTVFETYNAGTWKPSQQEHALRMILSWGNKKQCDKKWVAEASQQLYMLNSFRKEFRYLRLLWTQLSDHVSARDELSMAKLRLRLPYADEQRNIRKESSYIIEPHEVEMKLARLNAEKAVAESDLKKKTGILLYLQNLQKNGDKQNDPCPICRNQLNDKWSVLRCGHCFCFDCIPVLLNNCGGAHIVCPVCRERTVSGDISYIEGNSRNGELDDSIRGSYTTKIHAVVATLIRLRNEDPSVKVLIFSMWDRVLDVLSEALVMNNVVFRRLTSASKKRNQALSQFKTVDGITALLLPVNHGAKGLNLVEATHVFLIEPLINPADELQAVGRIHRIGQTKETFVHRFVVKATIEERMLSAIEMGGSEKWSKEKVTVRQLADLFSPVDK